MYLKIVFYVVLLLFTMGACSGGNDRMQATLDQSGENRVQLERVLEHYKDSGLKYQAACYLIENMKDCYYYSDSRIDSLKRLKWMSVGYGPGAWLDSVNHKWSGFSYERTEKKYDSQSITADYLIDNIDRAFDVWQKRPWAKYYTFGDFCQYILPYRVGNEPPERWREAYYKRYASAIDSIYTGSDVVKMVQAVREKFLADGFTWNTSFSLPHLGASFLLQHHVGECRESCDFTVYLLRSLGIPVGTDCYLASPHTHGPHSWTVLKDTTGGIVPFWLTETEVGRGLGDDRPKGKVYRKMYWGGVHDVTKEYFGENKVEIKVDCPLRSGEIYLGIFSCGRYTPVDKAVLQGGKAVFHNIEPEIRFQPMYKDMNTSVYRPAGYTFSMDQKGGIHYYIPDTLHRQRVELFRKYPAHAHLSYMQNMAGTQIEGSVSADFRKPVGLCAIPDTISVNDIEMYPRSSVPFRYVRFVTPARKRAQIAEVEFYERGSDEHPLPYKICSYPPVQNMGATPDKMMDGDILSFFSAKEMESVQIVFDFGTKHSIGKIHFVPRNDDNFIRPGDRYELFFHDGAKGWKSLGQQVATGHSLVYDHVPEGALLWLRDLTRGREEQIFIMQKDGKQLFYDTTA